MGWGKGNMDNPKALRGHSCNTIQSDLDQFPPAYALTSASLQNSRSCLHAQGLCGAGNMEPNFLLGVHYEFGESDHFLTLPE